MDESASYCHRAVCQLLVILLNQYYRICSGCEFLGNTWWGLRNVSLTLENYGILKVLHVVWRSHEGMTWTWINMWTMWLTLAGCLRYIILQSTCTFWKHYSYLIPFFSIKNKNSMNRVLMHKHMCFSTMLSLSHRSTPGIDITSSMWPRWHPPPPPLSGVDVTSLINQSPKKSLWFRLHIQVLKVALISRWTHSHP